MDFIPNADIESKIHAWLDSIASGLLGSIPLTCSLDVRDAAEPDRCVIVDCNRFPAGFQYLSKQDYDQAAALFSRGIKRHSIDPSKIHVFTEAHTRLVHYEDNVNAIKDIIRLAIPGATVTSSPGSVKDVDFIILNADLSDADQIDDAEANVSVQQTSMGWHQRSKGVNIALLSPWLHILANFLGLPNTTFEATWGVSKTPCRLEEPAHAKALAAQISSFDSMTPPHGSGVFVKNVSGTYGLGVSWVPPPSQGQEVASILSRLTRKDLDKMTYARHGARASSFVLQEGVPTVLFHEDDGSALEVVLMCVDGEFCSYFIRKGPAQSRCVVEEELSRVGNLNAPGASFIMREEFESNRSYANAARIVQSRLPLYRILARIACISMAQEQLIYQTQRMGYCPSPLLPDVDTLLKQERINKVAVGGERQSRGPGRPSTGVITSGDASHGVEDRDKKLRMMLSDIMSTQVFANRLAKQRFATEANKIRKLVFRQGGDNFHADFSARMRDLIKCLENPGESSSGEEIRATSSTLRIPVSSSSSSVPTASCNAQKENEEIPREGNHGASKGGLNYDEDKTKEEDKSLCAGLRASRVPDDAFTKKSGITLGSREHQVKTTFGPVASAAERGGASGDLRHDVDCALRKALTTFLQQAPPETRKNAAHTAQGVKKEILASLTSESVVEQCVERFLHQLAR